MFIQGNSNYILQRRNELPKLATVQRLSTVSHDHEVPCRVILYANFPSYQTFAIGVMIMQLRKLKYNLTKVI